MKKTLSMALTMVMMFAMCVTVFAAEGEMQLPDKLPIPEIGLFNVIIDFFAEVMRTIGEFIGTIFK
jgi:hypothetical protein